MLYQKAHSAGSAPCIVVKSPQSTTFPVSISPLCLKLFDDRFQPLQSPDEDDEELNDDTLPQWFVPVVYAKKYALNEALAYDKLLPVQGSVIPWFYGIHQVMCSVFTQKILLAYSPLTVYAT